MRNESNINSRRSTWNQQSNSSIDFQACLGMDFASCWISNMLICTKPWKATAPPKSDSHDNSNYSDVKDFDGNSYGFLQTWGVCMDYSARYCMYPKLQFWWESDKKPADFCVYHFGQIHVYGQVDFGSLWMALGAMVLWLRALKAQELMQFRNSSGKGLKEGKPARIYCS